MTDWVLIGIALRKEMLKQLLKKAGTKDEGEAVLKAIKAYLGVDE